MNFKKFKRLASAVLSFSMLVSMNVPAFAIDLKTAEKAENGNISVLADLADREESPKHNHTDASGNKIDGTPVWSEWEVKAEAGCEKPGYKMRHCTVEFCYEVEVEELNPVGHNYKDVSEKRPATCTQTGIKVVICQNDEKLHGSAPTNEEVEIPQVSHDFTTGIETTIPPTCKTGGQIGIACKYGCGTMDEASKRPDPAHPATGHSYKEIDPDTIKTAADLNALTSNEAKGITVNKVTCTSAGSLILECKNKRCDGTDAEKRIEKSIAATGHTYDKHLNGKDLSELTAAELQALKTATADGIQVTKEANCTEEGSITFECKNTWDNSASKTVSIPVLGHNWDEGKITKPALCETEGLKTSTCTRCKVTSDVAIQVTGHSFGKFDTTQNITNTLLKELASDPANAAKGIIAHPATCTSAGSLELECNNPNCDKGANATFKKTVNALGHDYDEGQFLAGDEATCLKDGKKTFTCKRGNDCDGGLDAAGHGKTYTVEVKASGHSYGKIEVDEDKKEVTAAALKGIETNEAKGIKIEAGSCTETGKLTLTCKNPNCEDKNVPKEYTILSSEHNWTRKTYREMTCKNDAGNPQTGMVQKTCEDCGASEWEVIPVAHTYEQEGWFDTAVAGKNYTVVTERTCTTDGTVNPICSICKKKDAVITYPMTGHSYDVKDYAKPDGDKASQDNLTAAGIDDVAYKAATCTSAGYQYYVCKNDGKCKPDATAKEVKKFDIAKKAHKYADTATTREATCTKPGIKAKFCQNPGCDAYDPEDSATELIAAAKGHSFAKKIHPTLEQVEEAGIEDVTTEEDLSFKGDCLTDGYDYYICDNAGCDKGTDPNGKKYIEKIITHKAPGQHSMTDGGTIPATCTHPQQLCQKCSQCEYREVIPTPPELAGEMDPMLEHDYSILVREVKPANCKEGEEQSGIAEYGCANGECGTTVMKVLPPEHKWKTATADNSDIGLEASDYKDGDKVPYQAPNCNADGYQYKKCPVCKKVVKEPITKLTHAYTEKATEAEDGTTINGEALSKASTCKENGYEYYRCTQPGCKKTDTGHYEKRTLPLDLTKHEFEQGHTDPTCVNPEMSGSICKICGAADPNAEITTGKPALGHADERDGFDGDYTKLPKSSLEELKAEDIHEPVSQAATCTKAGYEYRSCTGCAIGVTGHAIKVTLKATGHDYDADSFEEIPSTCTRPGLLVTTCKVCGEKAEQVISSQKPLGHEFKEFPRQEATCSETGKTAGWECIRCGASDTEDPVNHPARQTIDIVPDNHVWEKVDDSRNKPADCKGENGGISGTQVYKCKYHKTVERVATIPPVHQWEDPVMQNCVNKGYTMMPGLLYHTCAVCNHSEVMTTLTDCVECTDESHKAELAELQKTDPTYKFVVVKPKTLRAEPATCTSEGKTEGKQCSCEKMLTAQTPIAKIPHKGDLVIKNPGDCGHNGIKQHRCDMCGQYYGTEETFPSENAGKHTYEAIITGATCAKPMTVQEVCKTCGDKKPVQEVVGTKLPHKFGEDGFCTECHTFETEVATAHSASEEGGNTVIFTNNLSVNDTDKIELVEAGVIYYLSKKVIDSASTKEELEALLDFSTGQTVMKVASETDAKKLSNLKKFTQPIVVGERTDNKIAARAFIKVKVNGKEEYRYGDVIVRSYNEVFYPAE